MHIYIPQFVLGIIATLVVEVGICVVVGIISSKKNSNQNGTTDDNNGTNQDT